jgi:hypothetical protein
LASAAVVLGVALLFAAYRGNSQTFDEAVHVATGLEWIERGSYTMEPQHPPLTRVAVAVGPYLSGVRLTPGDSNLRRMWTEGDSVFFRGDSYMGTLTRARLGTLPFYLLLAGVVWLWGGMLLGRPGAALATALVALAPTVLGHAALATTDIGLTATVMLAVFALIRWLETPTIRRAALFGAAGALALCAKFSAIPYVGLCVLFFGGWRLWHLRMTGIASGSTGTPSWRREGWRDHAAHQLAAALAAGMLVVWMVYRFSVVDVGGVPLPAGELVLGFHSALDHSTGGHASYLLGERSTSGWWYYFPVAFALKTPLAILALGAIGTVVTIQRWRTDWRIATPVLVVLAVLVTGISTSINIGVRHILPIYAAWAVLAATGIVALWSAGRAAPIRRSLVTAALLWFTVDVVRETPHHLAYFNELSRRDPGALLLDSNLDWGQDMLRLSDELARRGISDVSVAILSRPVLGKLTTAHVRNLSGGERATGWVAVSETCRHTVYPKRCGPFDWLEGLEPVTRVGRSILLYQVPGAPSQLESTTRSPRLEPTRVTRR